MHIVDEFEMEFFKEREKEGGKRERDRVSGYRVGGKNRQKCILEDSFIRCTCLRYAMTNRLFSSKARTLKSTSHSLGGGGRAFS